MNTLSIGRRISAGLLLTASFVYPALAQNVIGTEAAQARTPIYESPEMSAIIADVKLSEHLPLVPPSLSVVEWRAYGDRLESALASGHEGLENAAMRLIIAYGDHFSLSEEAVFDVMRLYRDGDSERVRRMAVVALAQMDSGWAMKFLERSVRFEKSDQVRNTIRAILAEKDRQLAAL